MLIRVSNSCSFRENITNTSMLNKNLVHIFFRTILQTPSKQSPYTFWTSARRLGSSRWKGVFHIFFFIPIMTSYSLTLYLYRLYKQNPKHFDKILSGTNQDTFQIISRDLPNTRIKNFQIVFKL